MNQQSQESTYLIYSYYLITLVIISATISVYVGLTIVLFILFYFWMILRKVDDFRMVEQVLKTKEMIEELNKKTMEKLREKERWRKNYLMGLQMMKKNKTNYEQIQTEIQIVKLKASEEKSMMLQKLNGFNENINKNLSKLLQSLNDELKITIVSDSWSSPVLSALLLNIRILIKIVETDQLRKVKNSKLLNGKIKTFIIKTVDSLQKLENELVEKPINQSQWKQWLRQLLEKINNGKAHSQLSEVSIIKNIMNQLSIHQKNQQQIDNDFKVFEINKNFEPMKEEKIEGGKMQKETMFDKKQFVANLDVLLMKGFYQRQAEIEEQQRKAKEEEHN